MWVSLARLHVLEDLVCAFHQNAIFFVIDGNDLTDVAFVYATDHLNHIARFNFHGIAFAGIGGMKKQETD